MSLLLHLVFTSIIVWVTGNNLIIDISHHNGNIEWAKVKAAGVKSAMVKVSEGNHAPDKKFVTNWKQMKKYDIKPLGAYHYLRGAQTAASQVDLTKTSLKKVDFDAKKDILAIDVEEKYNENVTPDKMATTLKGVLDLLKPVYKNIYIYAGLVMKKKVSWDKYKKYFSSYNLWVPHYTTAKQPKILSIWKSKGYSLWQYTDKGKVNGIATNVDLNKLKQ